VGVVVCPGLQKILHREHGGTDGKNLRKIEAFTAELERAQRKAKSKTPA
jgi:hypothetical protein